jgi:drug/metabolite transporter (DMT)-like permease
MVVSTPIAWSRGGHGFWRTRHLRIQLIRSLCLVTATTCFFGGLRFLPLAEASAITFLAPMFAIVFSVPLLGERPTRAHWLSAIGGFAGVLLLIRPGSAVFHPATALLVLAAIANAFYQLLTRKVPGDTAHTTLFYSGLVGTIVLSIIVAATGGFHFALTPHETLLFVLLGVLAGLGHFCLIGAFLRAPASLVAPFTYVHMVWATLYGYFLFGHLPDGLSVLGMAVIVASGVALVWHERRASRLVSPEL